MKLLERGIFAAIIGACCTATCQGFVFITSETNPTIDLPGYTTTRLTVQTDEGVIVGFNFSGVDQWGRDAGFIGSLNQVELFGGAVSTIFADNNPVIDALAGLNRTMDSQFAVLSTPGFVHDASEGRNHLQASFQKLPGGDFGNEVTFAQITTPSGDLWQYSGSIDIRTPTGDVINRPVPNSFVLIDFPGGILEVESEPTLGLPGFTTHTISARTEAWNVIIGADLVLSGNRGIFGPMNQVESAGQPILTGDQGTAIERATDSHFLLTEADAEFGALSESLTSLQGFFDLTGTALTNADDTLPIAQIVTPNIYSATIEVSGYLKILGSFSPDNVAYQDEIVFVRSTIQLVPEPSASLLMLVAISTLTYWRIVGRNGSVA